MYILRINESVVLLIGRFLWFFCLFACFVVGFFGCFFFFVCLLWFSFCLVGFGFRLGVFCQCMCWLEIFLVSQKYFVCTFFLTFL